MSKSCIHYLTLFTGIPDPFFEIMRFNKFKNKYGDLVDDIEDLVMHGSQVSLANVSSVKLMSTNDFNTHSVVRKIDNHTKYSFAKRGDNGGFYGCNPCYGWNKVSLDALELLFTVKVKKADLHESTEILLNTARNRIKSIDNESVVGEQKMNPPSYQQKS